MPRATSNALNDQLAGLFGAGTCAGLSDGELLERFLACRDDGGERAFESLVTRHGPMVLGICRHFLDDPSDVHDAFQAVFLVLARRAGAIRKTESVGSWLYGVTVRVAARARAGAIRRRVRERRVLTAASAAALAGGSPEASPGTPVENDDGAAVVHEEVIRLPEPFRTPIVLCYFEGLTHDEAAARLSWPVGTVRSRLARARDRLRTRLTRRGVTVPSTIGPMAGWLIAGQSPSAASAAIRAATALPLPVHVPTSLAHAAVRLTAGQPAAVGSWSSASMALADGVLRTMMLKKLTVVGCVILSLGVGTGTGVVMIRRAGAQDSSTATAAATKPAANPAPPRDAGNQAIDPLVQKLLDAARQRVRDQLSFYEKGRITLNRYIDACAQLEKAELLAAADEGERMAARKRYADLLAQIERREMAELQVGRGTVADLAEIRQRRQQAELDLKTEREDPDEYQSKALKLLEAARARYESQEAFFKEGRITIDRFADASHMLAEAEQRTARNEFERVASRKRHLDRLKAIEAREETAFRAGRSTKADVTEAMTRRIEAELELHEALTIKGPADLTPILRRLDELERKVEQLQKARLGQGRP
jgi:RNA polymerase sigma factor (sigma-70 family)